jgi:hypothetical protein
MAKFDTPVDHGFVSGVATEVSEIGHHAGRGARKGIGAGVILGTIAYGAMGFLLPFGIMVGTGLLLAATPWISLAAVGAAIPAFAGLSLFTGAVSSVVGAVKGGITFGVLGTALGAVKGLFVGGKRIHDEKAAATRLNADIEQAHFEGTERARDIQTKVIAIAEEQQAQRSAFLNRIIAQGPKSPVEQVEQQKTEPSQGAGIA